MSTTAPPRPPRPSDPPDREEVEAPVEALIEEARQRAQRRRRRNAAAVALAALVGAVILILILILILLDGGAASQTASPAVSARPTAPAQAGTSRIAFISEPDGGGYCGLVYVMSPDGSAQRRLSPSGADPRDPHYCAMEIEPAWSSDGRKVAIVSSRDGKSGSEGIYFMNADGSGLKRLTGGVGAGGLAWSPTGQVLAFTRFEGRFSGIYVMQADGSGQRRLTNHARAGQLSWSPRGDKLAFVSQRDGNLEIYVMNADRSRERRLTHDTVRDSDPVWSPDGRRIAYMSKWQIYVMNADGSKQQLLARGSAPAWSPDGQRIAFERRLPPKYGRWVEIEPATYELWSMNANGSEPRMLTRKAAQPVWSPDGRKIAFARQCGERWAGGGPACHDIYVMNADGSGQRNLTRGAGRLESQPLWSPAQR